MMSASRGLVIANKPANMKEHQNTLDAEPRRQAERQVKARQQSADREAKAAESLQLIRELQVHQIELETQNEELVHAQGKANEALNELEQRVRERTAELLQSNVRLAQEIGFEKLLADLSSRFVNVPAEQVDGEIADAQRRVCECLGMDLSALWQWSGESVRFLTLTHLYRPLGGPPLPERLDAQELFPWSLQQLMAGQAIALSSIEQAPAEAARDQEVWRQYGVKTTLTIPLSTGGGPLIGAVSFNTVREERAWPESVVDCLQLVAQIFANAIARKDSDEALRKSYAEIKQLKDRLQAKSEYLKAEIKVSQPHREFIGRSQSIREVLHLVERVAPTGSAVLLTGETGTGKELLARAIHRLSPRKDRLMVEVNCAALPEGLVESELFGRERGAYTGAMTRQVGRFEIADGSTIFLDEVGELSPDVQAKLLRVLQEGQFQRLGDPKTRKVNVRVIAATNHDLAQAVRKGKFREDLYYRLNVFPIQVPPLRERLEDIPSLVLAFVGEFCSRMGKKVPKVPRRIMEAFQQNHWPGNVRELRNTIERALILSSGDSLQVTFLREELPEKEPATIADAERLHILKALERTGWRIKGPRGAAQLLGLKPGTLYSRMRKLEIPNRRQKDDLPLGR